MQTSTTEIQIQPDQRYLALYNGLNQLTTEELERILLYQDELCLDEFNYDEARGTYCPIAVAFGINRFHHDKFLPMTNKLCQSLIVEFGGPDFMFNQLKGTPGKFFRENRREDLLFVINLIIAKRSIL